MMARVVAALLFAGIIAGCSLGILEPSKDPSQFYVLTAINSPASAPITYSAGSAHNEISIGLGPVKFPAYLAREEIVTRTSANKVDISDIERWAEPLDKNFVTVLAQDLGSQLGAHVKTFPWYRPSNLDYQIALDISRFDTDTTGTAQLMGRWDIEDPDGNAILNSGEINITDAAQTGETKAATLSRAVGDLGTQLAGAIRATKHPAAHPKTG